jgi:hypothetical protein
MSLSGYSVGSLFEVIEEGSGDDCDDGGIMYN